MKKITFTNFLEVSEVYAPKPAIQHIPEWYKKMESSFPRQRTPDATPSIKKCIPVLDALTFGYIIVSPCDIYISIKDGEPTFNSVLNGFIESHPRKQAYKHPNATEFEFPKWINPWGIRTPKGYSTLFIPPMHNPNPWFEALEGVVDTDTYFAPVNFPFILKDVTWEGLIPAGTPIVQVIPFKRDKWESTFNNDKTEIHSANKLLISQFFDRYKKLFWSKKSFK